MKSESGLRQRVIRRQRARVHADHVVARSNVVNLKVSGVLRDNSTPPLPVIQHQVDTGQSFRIHRPRAFKTQIVEHAAGNPSKIHNAKIYHADSLPDQVYRRLVLGGHANRLGTLRQRERDRVLALAHVSELVAALLVCLSNFSIVEPYTEPDQPLLTKIKSSIHVVIAEDAAFNDA